MVICIAALIILSIMSIFSAKYRAPAKEAFRCVWRMATFRPCDVQLETKIKTKVTSKLMFAPSLARFFYRYFKPLSWLFTIAFFASLGYSLYGIYNIFVYGSCDPTNPSSCVITSAPAQNQLFYMLSCYELPIVIIVIIIVISLAIILLRKRKVNKNG